MGNYINKFFSYNNEIGKEEANIESSTDEGFVEKDIMCTPPVIHKMLPIDPRSVTTGIDRTPIEVNSTPVGLNKRVMSAIPRHLQRKPYLETDIDKVMLCLTPKKCEPRMEETAKLQFLDVRNEDINMQLTPTVDKLNHKKVITSIEKERHAILGLDPRSPAADFDRTPILKPKSIERLRARSQECLHRRGSYETDVFYSRFSYCEMSSQFTIPEIQALPDLAAHITKSLNLVNVDCDDRSNESDSSSSSHSSRTETISESGKEITVTKNSKLIYRKINKNACQNPILTSQQTFTLKENQLDSESEHETSAGDHSCNIVYIKKEPQHKEAPIDDNDTIKVWRDSLVLDNPTESELTDSDDIQIVHEKISQVPKEEVIITFDDENIVKGTPLKVSKSQNDMKKAEVTGKKKKAVKSEIKIVTDEKKVFNSNDKNGNDSTKIRTPLGNRSNNGKMHLISAKSPQQVFKNKSTKPKMLQENTPPHKKYVTKAKLSGVQWDPDSTVII